LIPASLINKKRLDNSLPLGGREDEKGRKEEFSCNMAVSQVKSTGSPRIWLKTLKETLRYSTSKSQSKNYDLEIALFLIAR